MVITARTRNAVTALSGTRVRIPSLPPVPRTRQRLRNQIKGLTKTVMPFFLLVALPDGIRCTSTASGRRNNVAFRFTALTAERLVGRIPSLPPKRRISRAFNRSAFSMPKDRCLYSQAPAKVPFEVLIRNSTSANLIAVEKFRNLCYNNK